MPTTIDSQRQKPSRPSCRSSRSKTSAPPLDAVVGPLALADAVDVDLERPVTPGGQNDAGSLRSALVTFIEWQPVRPHPSPRALCALALSGAALAGNGGFAPVEPESPNAEGISQSYWFVTIFTGAIFVLVEGTLIVFVVRYRRRRTRARTARRSTATRTSSSSGRSARADPGRDRRVRLRQAPGIRTCPRAPTGPRWRSTGHQFYWQFQYPNGVIAVDRLRAPVGQTTAWR